VDSLSNPLLRRRARHVVTEIARARNVVTLLGSGRIRDIGPLLNASHASLRDDLEVSSPELDCVVDAARAAGAVGARMTGGGFGGSALALVQHTAVTAVTHAVLAAAARHAHPQPTVHQVRSAVGHSDAAVSAHERAQTEV
jgi:galactokinase